MQIQSKLPDVGTTIFTVMSSLAVQHNAINLGQGFPHTAAPLSTTAFNFKSNSDQFYTETKMPENISFTLKAPPPLRKKFSETFFLEKKGR